MRNGLFILLCIIITSCKVQKNINNGVSSVIDASLEKQQVVSCFSNYKSAIQIDEVLIATNYVDSRTINYYQDILDKIKNADSTAVNEMKIMGKMMVFFIRHQTSKEKILQLNTGQQLLAFTIQTGMVGSNSFNNIELGEIELDGNLAKGQAVINENAEAIYFHFHKEQEKWKIDLTSVLSAANQSIKQLVNQSDQDENEYLFTWLEMTTGKKPTRKIWQPIKE